MALDYSGPPPWVERCTYTSPPPYGGGSWTPPDDHPSRRDSSYDMMPHHRRALDEGRMGLSLSPSERGHPETVVVLKAEEEDFGRVHREQETLYLREAQIRLQREALALAKERGETAKSAVLQQAQDQHLNREQAERHYRVNYDLERERLKLERERLELAQRTLEMEEDRTRVMAAIARGEPPLLTRQEIRELERVEAETQNLKRQKGLWESLQPEIRSGRLSRQEATDIIRASC